MSINKMNDNILSHTHPTKVAEKLEEHKTLIKTYLEKIINEKEMVVSRILCKTLGISPRKQFLNFFFGF